MWEEQAEGGVRTMERENLERCTVLEHPAWGKSGEGEWGTTCLLLCVLSSSAAGSRLSINIRGRERENVIVLTCQNLDSLAPRMKIAV